MVYTAFQGLFSHWWRHPGQLLTLLAGLALATALWSGVQAINAEARAAYDRAASTLGQDQLSRLVRADGQPVPLADYVALRRAGYLVSPVISGELRGDGARLRILGIDLLTIPPQAQAPVPITGGDIDIGQFLGDGMLLVNAATAAGALPADLPPLSITDTAPPAAAITDIGTAARLLAQTDPSYLLVDPDQPAGLGPLSDATDLVLAPPTQAGDITRLTDSFHLNLTAFGLLSFAVGLFIVHAAIGLAFEQRRSSFRTLRAVGVPLGQLIWLLAAEIIVFAVVAGAIGVALGYAIAATLLPGVAGTLRGLYGAQIDGTLGFNAVWAIGGLAIAVLGAAVAGAQALVRVAKMPLLAAAQPRAWAIAAARTTRVQGVAAFGLIITAVMIAMWGDGLLAGFACLAALLIGAALALPGLLALMLRGAERMARGPFVEWLLADTRQQLPGLSLALMALLLALSANIGVSTMVGSFRATFVGWLDQRLASELYVTARTEAEAAEIRVYLADQGLILLPILSTETRLGGAPADVFGIADDATYRDNWPLLVAAPDVWDRVADGTGALVNEQLYRRDGLRLGDTVTLDPGPNLPIVGVYSDYGNPTGQAIIGLSLFRETFPTVETLRFALRVAPDQVADLATALRDRFDLPTDSVLNQAQIKQFSLEIFEQTFRVTGALNILTLGVAAFALLTSLLTLAGMRLPQLAPVWALGQTRSTLARVELARSLLLATLTFGLALPTGLALAWVLLAVVNVAAFGWRLPMHIFPGDWLQLLIFALIAAALAAAWPALRLARTPPAALLKVFAHER